MLIGLLKKGHVGRRVIYAPRFGIVEFGRISSWNKHLIFVQYDGEIHTKATSPEDLTMLSKHVCRKCFDSRKNKEVSPPLLDFDKLWDMNAQCWCVMSNVRIDSNPPQSCPFVLEHLMETQNATF